MESFIFENMFFMDLINFIIDNHLRDFALRTILTQHPLQVINGGWSLGSAV